MTNTSYIRCYFSNQFLTIKPDFEIIWNLEFGIFYNASIKSFSTNEPIFFLKINK